DRGRRPLRRRRLARPAREVTLREGQPTGAAPGDRGGQADDGGPEELMATDPRTEDIRRQIEHERNELARSVDQLRTSVKEATDVRTKIAEHLPVVAAGALAAGFVLSGGVGATLRLLFRRDQEE